MRDSTFDVKTKTRKKDDGQAVSRQSQFANSAVLDMMSRGDSAEKAVISGMSGLTSTQAQPQSDISSKILARFGMPSDSYKIYRDKGLSDLGQPGYARGNEIHVSDELYSPGTSFGEHLILHEAAHVLQSGLGGISGGGLLDDSGLEAQAEALAAGGAAGAGLDVSGFAAPTAENAPMLGWNPFTAIKNHFDEKKRREEYEERLLNRRAEILRISPEIQAAAQMYAPDVLARLPEQESESSGLNKAIGVGRMGVGALTGLSAAVTGVGKLMTQSKTEGTANAGTEILNVTQHPDVPFALGTLGMLSSSIGLYQSATATGNAIGQGATSEAVIQGGNVLSNLAGLGKAGFTTLASNAGNAGTVISPELSSAVMPWLGVATGSLQAGVGVTELISAGVHRSNLSKLMNQRDDNNVEYLNAADRMTAKQLHGQARKQTVAGFWDTLTGSAVAAGGIASLFTAGIGSLVSGAGALIGTIGKFFHMRSAEKSHIRDTVEDAVGLSAKINAVKEQYNVDSSSAEKIVLRSMGCESQKDLFERITARRAVDLYERSRAGDTKAQEMVNASGLSEVEPSTQGPLLQNGKNYSLLGIASKLGGSGPAMEKRIDAIIRARQAAAHAPAQQAQQQAHPELPAAIPAAQDAPPRRMSISVPSGARAATRQRSNSF